MALVSLGYLGKSGIVPHGGALGVIGRTGTQIPEIQAALNVHLTARGLALVLVDGTRSPATSNALTWLLGPNWYSVQVRSTLLAQVRQATTPFMADVPKINDVRPVQIALSVTDDGELGPTLWMALDGRFPAQPGQPRWWQQPFAAVRQAVLTGNLVVVPDTPGPAPAPSPAPGSEPTPIAPDLPGPASPAVVVPDTLIPTPPAPPAPAPAPPEPYRPETWLAIPTDALGPARAPAVARPAWLSTAWSVQLLRPVLRQVPVLPLPESDGGVMLTIRPGDHLVRFVNGAGRRVDGITNGIPGQTGIVRVVTLTANGVPFRGAYTVTPSGGIRFADVPLATAPVPVPVPPVPAPVPAPTVSWLWLALPLALGAWWLSRQLRGERALAGLDDGLRRQRLRIGRAYRLKDDATDTAVDGAWEKADVSEDVTRRADPIGRVRIYGVQHTMFAGPGGVLYAQANAIEAHAEEHAVEAA